MRDTGWLAGWPAGATWRVANTTFTCTGNVTHELPAGARVCMAVWLPPSCLLLCPSSAELVPLPSPRLSTHMVCTALPAADFLLVEVERMSAGQYALLLAGGLALLVMTGGLFWCAHRRGAPLPVAASHS